jgi:hypothetical protein
MELDDLKNSWKQTNINKISNKDIMELIQLKSYGPLAALKRGFKKQIRLMAIMPIILIATNIKNIEGVLTSVLFWSYVLLCVGVILFSSYNYRIVTKMESMDGMVKSNLEQQIQLLEMRLRWNIRGIRIALLFFILLIEILPYFQQYRMLNTWHALSPVIRFSSYAALFLFQYFVSRRLKERDFGTHITYLKMLVKEIQ